MTVVVAAGFGSAPAILHVAPLSLAIPGLVLEEPFAGRTILEPVAFPGQEFDSVEDDRVENMNGLLKGLPRPTEFNGINPSSIESSSEEAVQGLDSNLCRSCLMGQWSHDIGEDLTASVDVGDTFAALLHNGASNGFYPEETR